MSRYGGRPPKCTPQRTERICEAIKTGASLDAAARYGGVHYASLYNWRKRGEEVAARVEADPSVYATLDKEDLRYLKFFEALQDANDELALSCNLVIYNAGINQGDPRWAAWMLERRFPENNMAQTKNIVEGRIEVVTWEDMIRQALDGGDVVEGPGGDDA